MVTRQEIERIGHTAQVLIDAALANRDIKTHLADPHPRCVWTIDDIRHNPTCRVEWEHVVVVGSIGEALAAARHKKWGTFVGVCPLHADDPVHWCRILYLYKATSPSNRRVEQRRALKRILGRQHRSLVTAATRATKRDFLASLTELGAHTIRRRLHFDPGLRPEPSTIPGVRGSVADHLEQLWQTMKINMEYGIVTIHEARNTQRLPSVPCVISLGCRTIRCSRDSRANARD